MGGVPISCTNRASLPVETLAIQNTLSTCDMHDLEALIDCQTAKLDLKKRISLEYGLL